MSFVGTFGSFTTARLGIYAAQKGLSVTGNNISNINTIGYTRQSLDQVSLKTGGSDRYRSQYDVHVGTGVLCTGVSQIRDPYLDIRYRTEMSSVGAMDTKLAGLNDLAAILDEVADGDDENGIIEAQLSALTTALRNLSNYAGEEEYDVQVRASADALVKLFNTYANKLEQLEKNTLDGFHQDIEKVNDILTNIRDLNSRIRKSDIHGDSALEMRDDRNLLIDQLSQYMKIDVVYSMEDLGGGQMVEKLTIKLGNANPDNTVDTDGAMLVDGVYATQLSITQVPKLNPKYDPNDVNHNNQYLDANGNPTNDVTKAAMVDSSNYGITLGKLLDSKNREWRDVKEVKTEISQTQYNNGQANPPADTKVNKADMDSTISTDYYSVVDPNNVNQNRYYSVVTTTSTTKEVVLDDNDLYGSLQATRELLTESGEFATADTINNVDENAAIKRGIPYYQMSLDLLARKIATEFNKANEGYQMDENGNYLDANGNVLQDNGINLTKYMTLTDAQKTLLETNGVKIGGPLFSIRGDTDDVVDADGNGFTASNISVSLGWSTGATHIVNTFIKPLGGIENSTQNDNIDHLVALMEKGLTYNPQDLVADAKSDHIFDGSFQEMLNNMNSILGNDARSTGVMLDTYYNASVELDTSRDNVSGVDLNDEAMNLMQYQKSYTAACRLMTALDQALDKLINNTGIVGL